MTQADGLKRPPLYSSINFVLMRAVVNKGQRIHSCRSEGIQTSFESNKAMQKVFNADT